MRISGQKSGMVAALGAALLVATSFAESAKAGKVRTATAAKTVAAPRIERNALL